MKIYLGADHGGFTLKNVIRDWLMSEGHDVEDLGALALDPSDDYPRYAFAVADRVMKEKAVGVLLCRSGGGMAIAANRISGVRAVDCADTKAAELARLKNDANVLAIPADWVDESRAKAVIRTFLSTTFSGEERHVRRIAQLDSGPEKNA